MNNLITDINSSGIATITLNRPEKNNAFDDILVQNLIQEFNAIAANPDIRVLILKGKGNNFCAGADIEWMQRSKNFSAAKNLADASQLALMLKTLNQLNKPTIVLAQGKILGGGNGLVSCADIAIATHDASFCFTEVKLGLAAASIGPYVIAAIGTRMARRYFLTAEPIDAVTAKNIGLVHEVVASDKLESTGMAIAQNLVKNGPEAMLAAKQLIARCQPITQDLIDYTVKLIAEMRVSPEAQEGLQAFLEKRKPNWIKS